MALNAERAKEEAAGLVRWLRPDYQIPRFAKGAAAAKTGELDLGENVVAIDRPFRISRRIATRIRSPSSAPSSPPAVPWMRPTLARGFKRGGKRIEPRIAQALTTLVRYGRIGMTPDGALSRTQGGVRRKRRRRVASAFPPPCGEGLRVGVEKSKRCPS